MHEWKNAYSSSTSFRARNCQGEAFASLPLACYRLARTVPRRKKHGLSNREQPHCRNPAVSPAHERLTTSKIELLFGGCVACASPFLFTNVRSKIPTGGCNMLDLCAKTPQALLPTDIIFQTPYWAQAEPRERPMRKRAPVYPFSLNHFRQDWRDL